MMPKKWCLSSNQTDNRPCKRLYQASGDTWSEAPPVSNCDEGFINPGYLRMLFVLFDASRCATSPWGRDLRASTLSLRWGKFLAPMSILNAALFPVSLPMPSNADALPTLLLSHRLMLPRPHAVGRPGLWARFTEPAAFSLCVQDSPLPGFSLSGESVSIVTELRE
jgi:hypothetical protein